MNTVMMIAKLAILSYCIIQSFVHSLPVDDEWTLRILHTNDMHARFAETAANSAECMPEDSKNKKCYGGFARIATLVRQAKNSSTPALFLNAGDTYQGSIWFTIYKWKIVSDMLNLLKPDAISLGNHEFDEHTDGLIPFIDAAEFPIVTSNLDLVNEPKLAKTNLQKSVVLNVDGHKVGIIGFLTPTTAEISHPDNVTFLDEILSVREEAEKLKLQGVEILIALGHSGFEMEKKIAVEVDGLDLVIGGHTNTFLYNQDQPDLEVPEGIYPTEVTQRSGRKVYVVQAYAYTKYLGNMQIVFDKNGEIKSIVGEPILVDGSIEQAQDVLDRFEYWHKNYTLGFAHEVGSTAVFLDGDSKHCRAGECNLGNLIVDAMIEYNLFQYENETGWTDAAVAIHNSGSVRTSISKSNKHKITRGNIKEVLPFNDVVEKIYVTSKLLLRILERSVYNYELDGLNNWDGGVLHFSGLQVVYDLSEPKGSRVKSVFIRCADCDVPEYEPLEDDKIYKILINRFIRRGGDGYNMLKGVMSTELNATTEDIFADYVSRRSPVYSDVEGRTKFVVPTANRMSVDDMLKENHMHLLKKKIYSKREIQMQLNKTSSSH